MENMKQYAPTNGIVEPDFLEYLKKTFKRWEELHEKGVSVGSREISKFSATVQGAKLNARFGFETASQRWTDKKGQEHFTFMIYKNREAMEIENPLYHFETKIIS